MRHQLNRPLRLQDEKLSELAREIAANAFKILRQIPPPDTFLGRKTQEPFPKEQKE